MERCPGGGFSRSKIHVLGSLWLENREQEVERRGGSRSR